MLKDFVGKTVSEIRKYSDKSLIFFLDNGNEYVMEHIQECYERVYIEDICGDLKDLIGSPITLAEVRTNKNQEYDDELGGIMYWTFYEFATAKGNVTIRWNGSSNGYYSVAVSFYQRNDIMEDYTY